MVRVRAGLSRRRPLCVCACACACAVGGRVIDWNRDLRRLSGMTGTCLFGAEHRMRHPPGGLVRNSWSGEKGPGPSGVSVRTRTMYVVSGCSSVSRTLGSRTIWCRSSSCGRGLVLSGQC